MKKQTKVLLAAAALTLGASFTAMAAETYDWKMEDGQWVCYDEDGDVYDNEWCESAGKDYYVGDDGVLTTSSWVDGFYVDSTGAKTTNAWKYLIPEGEEENDDAEEAWFYFGSKGAVTKGKKVIDGKTYYFDSQSGEMLTGWVTYVDNDNTEEANGYTNKVVYVNEDGSRAANMWVKTVAPGVDEEEEDEPDYFWYYIQSKGAPKTGRALDINGETYFFNNNAQMLSGWVVTEDDKEFTNANATEALGEYKTAYFCGDADQGWAKKSTWINEYRSTVDSADVDVDDLYWFWVDSKGKVFRAAVTDSNAAAEQKFDNGESTTAPVIDKTGSKVTTEYAATKEINGKTYIFNQDGEMLSGLVETLDGLFYYGKSSDGSMQTGEVVLEDAAEEEAYNFYFAKTKKDEYGVLGSAVTGAAAGKLYNNGILVTHSDDNEYKEVAIGGYHWIIDQDGNIKTSQKQYKAMNEETEKKETYLNTEEITFGKTGRLKGSYSLDITAVVE